MSYQYSEFQLSGETFERYEIDGSINEIKGLSSLNIFIGANNAGKSRFMRELAKMNPASFGVQDIDFVELRNAYNIFNEYFQPAWRQFERSISSGTIRGVGALDFKKINFESYIPDKITDDFFERAKPNPKSLLVLLTSLRDNGLSNISYFLGGNQNAVAAIQLELQKDYSNTFFGILNKFILERVIFNKYYIPTLRSLNDFDHYQVEEAIDIFEARFKQIYGFTDETKVDIFTGQKMYERIKAMLLGTRDERNRMRQYEGFLQDKLFDGKEIVIIPRGEDDVVYVGIDGTERAIYDLGDGIQSLIILTFPFFESEHGLFFIEEPEMNMHPGMQRKFLEAIQANPQHQYFITTHSNHLLDLTIDYSNISIYTFRLEGDTHKVNLVTQGDKNILDLIGARATSVFLANKSIWVEGITDRLYIRKYLELYLGANPLLEKTREDIDYIFVEYGGNNITHWSFLDDSSDNPTINVNRITSNLLLITDQDGDAKQERKAELVDKLGDRYLLLDAREIENTLSLEVITRVVCEYEKLEPIDISRLDTSKLSGTYMGDFIEKELAPNLGLELKRRGGYRAASGTLKQKLAFCHKALDLITYDNMPESAKTIAERIYTFIKSVE